MDQGNDPSVLERGMIGPGELRSTEEEKDPSCVELWTLLLVRVMLCSSRIFFYDNSKVSVLHRATVYIISTTKHTRSVFCTKTVIIVSMCTGGGSITIVCDLLNTKDFFLPHFSRQLSEIHPCLYFLCFG